MVEIREARDADRVSAMRVLWKAFEATTDFQDMIKEDWVKRWNSPQEQDWAYVAVDNGKVVANLSFFATKQEQQVIRKRSVRFAGVWAVATDPVYRRMGLVRKLFEASFPRMREEKTCLSILDPFHRSFYEKFGYAIAEKRMKHVLKRNHIRVGPTREDISVREGTWEDLSTIAEIERGMARFGSRFFTQEGAWGYLFKHGHVHILEDSSGPVGSVWFKFTKDVVGHKIEAAMTRYTHDSVLPNIVELVSKYAENASETTWFTDCETPVRHFLSNIHASKSFLIGSMMMRVVDFEGYCNTIAIPEEAHESVVLKLDDEHCPWNSDTYRLAPDGGSLETEKVDAEPDIKLNAFQLSQVISGYTPPVQLRALGEIHSDSETARKLEMIFPQDIFVSYTRF
jgi:predicted acetyltransferase